MSSESQRHFAGCCKPARPGRTRWAALLSAGLLCWTSGFGLLAREESAPKQENAGPTRAPKKEAASKPTGSVVYRKEARIVLGDARTARGLALFRAEKELTFKHTTGGISYSKRFAVDEIETIRIRQWRGQFVRRNKQGEIYRFEPYEFEVRLKSGATLARKGQFLAFLKQFVLQNDNGRVMLFTFWVDLRRPDGSWFTGMRGNERTEAHKDVVRMIEFVKPKPEPDPDPDPDPE